MKYELILTLILEKFYYLITSFYTPIYFFEQRRVGASRLDKGVILVFQNFVLQELAQIYEEVLK